MTETQTQTDIPEDDVPEVEDVPEEKPPKVRKQRPKKYDTTREYNRRCYHDVVKLQDPKVCPYCDAEVVCRSSLLRHQRRSKHCQWKRAAAELAELRDKSQSQNGKILKDTDILSIPCPGNSHVVVAVSVGTPVKLDPNSLE